MVTVVFLYKAGKYYSLGPHKISDGVMPTHSDIFKSMLSISVSIYLYIYLLMVRSGTQLSPLTFVITFVLKTTLAVWCSLPFYRLKKAEKKKKPSKVKHNFQEIELATELKYKPRTSHSKPSSSLYYLRKLRTEMEKVPSICT